MPPVVILSGVKRSRRIYALPMLLSKSSVRRSFDTGLTPFAQDDNIVFAWLISYILGLFLPKITTSCFCKKYWKVKYKFPFTKGSKPAIILKLTQMHRWLNG